MLAKFKVGDKVNGIGTYVYCRDIEITSMSECGQWLGFCMPDSHDEEEIADGTVPNWPVFMFELSENTGRQ